MKPGNSDIGNAKAQSRREPEPSKQENAKTQRRPIRIEEWERKHAEARRNPAPHDWTTQRCNENNETTTAKPLNPLSPSITPHFSPTTYHSSRISLSPPHPIRLRPLAVSQRRLFVPGTKVDN
jgi:hypothetical protein